MADDPSPERPGREPGRAPHAWGRPRVPLVSSPSSDLPRGSHAAPAPARPLPRPRYAAQKKVPGCERFPGAVTPEGVRQDVIDHQGETPETLRSRRGGASGIVLATGKGKEVRGGGRVAARRRMRVPADRTWGAWRMGLRPGGADRGPRRERRHLTRADAWRHRCGVTPCPRAGRMPHRRHDGLSDEIVPVRGGDPRTHQRG
jgi:hypothetical protein